MSSIDTPLVEVRNLAKHFGSVIALNGISMVVKPREVLCLLGDNGAGKSTLINTLVGRVTSRHRATLSSAASRRHSTAPAMRSMPA